MISALGKNGQYLNVIPGQNLIWLRMGDAPDGAEVSFILNNKIWKYVNELECTPSGIPGNFETGISVSMFPNPASHYFSVESIKKISEVNLYTQTGNMQKSFKKSFNEMDISDLKPGFYYVQIKFEDDNSHYERLLVLTKFK
jgi:hypothetical protein